MGRRSYTVSDVLADLAADCDSSRRAPVDVEVELGGAGVIRYVRFTLPGVVRVTWSFGKRVVRDYVSLAAGVRERRYYRGSPDDAEVRRVLGEKLSFPLTHQPSFTETRSISRR